MMTVASSIEAWGDSTQSHSVDKVLDLTRFVFAFSHWVDAKDDTSGSPSSPARVRHRPTNKSRPLRQTVHPSHLRGGDVALGQWWETPTTTLTSMVTLPPTHDVITTTKGQWRLPLAESLGEGGVIATSLGNDLTPADAVTKIGIEALMPLT